MCTFGCCCCRGFLRLGLERQSAVGIMGANCPEWFISSVAAIFAGGLSCGVYTTNRDGGNAVTVA